jgi:hypothetical protein
LGKRTRDIAQVDTTDSKRLQTCNDQQQQQQFKTPIDTSRKKRSQQQQQLSSARDSTMVFRPTALAKIITDSVTKSQQKKQDIMVSSGIEEDIVITTEDDDPSFYSGFGTNNKNNNNNKRSALQEIPYTDSTSCNIIHKRSTVSMKNVHDEEKTVDNINSDYVTCNINYESPPWITTSTGRRKQQTGPFSQRLKYLRDSMKGNIIRFQSGQYPFQNCTGRMYSSNKDTNDPRTRASIFVDVTINSNPILVDGGYNVNLTMALGFIHKLEQIRSKHQRTYTNSETIVHELNGNISWILFTIETVRQYDIRQGTELRIYDFTCIPFAMSSLSNHFSISILSMTGDNDDQGDSKTTQVKWVLACTQLCELYPSNILPLLPKIPFV